MKSQLCRMSPTRLLLASWLLLCPFAGAEVQIDFNDGNGLDRQGIGGSITATDPSVNIAVTLSTVDIIGFDESTASPPDNIGHVMNSRGGTSGNANALGPFLFLKLGFSRKGAKLAKVLEPYRFATLRLSAFA